jgi:hypothetical protein
VPFTPSHAVVALPFVRTPLVPAAVAVGAMTPDLPLFLRGMGPSYAFTHSTANVVWTALIALVLLALWRMVLRPALVQLTPDAVAARLPDAGRRSGGEAARELFAPRERPRPGSFPVLLLVVSLLLGVLTHIAWDLFTHEGRWGVEAIPALQEQWGPLLGYKWLQHGSSAIGLVILAVYAVLWLRRRGVVRRPRMLPAWVRWVWYLTLPAFLIAGWFIGLAALGPLGESLSVQQLAYRTLPRASGLWGVFTVLLCATIVLLSQRTGSAESEDSRSAGQ